MKFYFVFIFIAFSWATTQHVSAEITPDPNFHIYICFGQSNMEGASPIIDDDKLNVNERFQVMTVAADDMQHLDRSVGEWSNAVPPLCRWNTGLTPADFFGRTLVDSLADSIRVGVIVVAMGGSGIDAFDKNNYTQYYQNADAWQKGLMNIYGGNPYSKIVEIATIAQKAGVVKGILLHQGETNNGQPDWPLKVKKIYYNLLTDLDIEYNSIPLLAGEMLHQDQGGICWGMNSIIATLPNYIPNSYVVSSEGCSGIDDFHFTNAGQKELGHRYGLQMLSLLKTDNTIHEKTVDLLTIESNAITMLTGSSRKVPIEAVYGEEHVDVSYKCEYEIGNTEVINITNGIIETLKDGESLVTATYTGKLGEQQQLVFSIISSTFPLTNQLFNPTIWENGTFREDTKTLQTGQWGFGGWQYMGIDLSGYKYIVAKLGSENNADVTFNIYDGNSYWGSPASYKFGSNSEVIVDLNNAKKNDGSLLDPSHIYIAGFWSNGNNPFVIDTVFLSNSSEYDIPTILVLDSSEHDIRKIDGFAYIEGSGPSSSKSFYVYGDMLNNSIQLEVPLGYEISLFETEAYSTMLNLNQEDGVVDTTEIFVRLEADLIQDSYPGTLTINSDGAQEKKITLKGSVEKAVGVNKFSNENATILSSEFYTLTGQRIHNIDMQSGVFIRKDMMSDGRNITLKLIK